MRFRTLPRFLLMTIMAGACAAFREVALPQLPARFYDDSANTTTTSRMSSTLHQGPEVVLVPAAPDDAAAPPADRSSAAQLRKAKTAIPLVVTLAGYCLSGPQQDAMQLEYAALVDSWDFALLRLSAPQAVDVCALCATSINASRLAGLPNMVATAQTTLAMTGRGQYVNPPSNRPCPHLRGPVGAVLQCAGHGTARRLVAAPTPSPPITRVRCTAWDATDACCQPRKRGRAQGDGPYILAAVDAALEAVPEIDRRRVYLIGIASGGFMALRMACDAPSRFAGQPLPSRPPRCRGHCVWSCCVLSLALPRLQHPRRTPPLRRNRRLCGGGLGGLHEMPQPSRW